MRQRIVGIAVFTVFGDGWASSGGFYTSHRGGDGDRKEVERLVDRLARLHNAEQVRVEVEFGQVAIKTPPRKAELLHTLQERIRKHANQYVSGVVYDNETGQIVG